MHGRLALLLCLLLPQHGFPGQLRSGSPACAAVPPASSKLGATASASMFRRLNLRGGDGMGEMIDMVPSRGEHGRQADPLPHPASPASRAVKWPGVVHVPHQVELNAPDVDVGQQQKKGCSVCRSSSMSSPLKYGICLDAYGAGWKALLCKRCGSDFKRSRLPISTTASASNPVAPPLVRALLRKRTKRKARARNTV